MTEMSNEYLPRIEWEGLQNPWEVQVLNESPVLPSGSERVELRRDEQYRVEAKIFCTPDFSRPELHRDFGQPGDIIPDYRIEGSSHHAGYLYELEHCVVDNTATPANSSGLP